jgi:serine phosphatase RsbU (regulator of sigma subunit)
MIVPLIATLWNSTDRLFFYSDGVSECPGAGEEMYGDYNMLQTLEANRARH